MDERVVALLTRYLAELPAHAPIAAASVVFLGLAAWALRRRDDPLLAKAVTGIALAVGLALAWRQMSVYDDAFVSFRYAENLARGRGLVFNVGEYVQGYTNPLWTLLIAAFLPFVPGQAPYVALVGNGLAFVANVGVVYAIGRRVHGERGFVPIAAALVAVQHTMTAFATSGMETQLASLLVNVGLLGLVTRRDAIGAGWAGLALAGSTLTRPDHTLFHAAAGLVVLARVLPTLGRAVREAPRPTALWRAGGDQLVAIAAPGALFAGWLAFCAWYYSDTLPNTYYAKSASLWYPSQGLVYSASFWLASHLWLLLPILGLWILVPARNERARELKLFVLVSVVAQQLYVLKVGGDFMFGRFFVAVVPLILLGVEATWRDLAARGREIAASAVLVAASATIGGGTLLPADGWISDESANYDVVRLFPLTIGHASFDEAQIMRPLGDADLRPTIGSCCIGMLGYYVDTELIDFHGLTDRRVARMPLKQRGMPGHEKRATDAYVRKRGVMIARRVPYEAPYDALTRIAWGPDDRDRWRILAYDHELMAKIRERIPEARFVDFDRYLARYLRDVDQLDAARIQRDLRFFDAYWFAHNEDGARRDAIVDALERAREAERG